MNREETAQLLAMMKAAWPNHPIPDPEAAVAAYWMGLDDVPCDAAVAAFRSHLKDPQRGRFFPTVADLRGGLPPSPRLALASGARREAPVMKFRVYDADADDYVELAEPVPKGTPEFEELTRRSREQMHLAHRREHGGEE